MIVLIAGCVIEFNLVSSMMKERMEKYEIMGMSPAFFSVSEVVDEFSFPQTEPTQKTKYYSLYQQDKDLIQVVYDEIGKHIYGIITYHDDRHATIQMKKEALGTTEYLLTEFTGMYFILKARESIFIHSSSFIYENRGILLVATSGTGKSTHARLWKQYEDIVQLNDDKNLIVLEDNQLVIYPNPWSGKHGIDNNLTARLDTLVFVHRSKVNETKKLSKKSMFVELIPHMMNTSFLYDREKWNTMTDAIIAQVNGIDLYCDISKEAVDTLKKTLEA